MLQGIPGVTENTRGYREYQVLQGIPVVSDYQLLREYQLLQ